MRRPRSARWATDLSVAWRAFRLTQRPRSLRTQLLVELGFLTSAAVLVVGVTTALIAGADLRQTAWALVTLWLGSTAVFLLFGAHVVGRLVLQPLGTLSNEADALAESAGQARGETAHYDSAELAHLAEHYRAMAADLVDVQSHIVRVEKLAGIGTLAAGVAHEVRNPLGALSTYVEVLRRRGADPTIADAMQGAAERIERTVQSLLTYARTDVGDSDCDLNEAIRTSLRYMDAQGVLKRQRLVLELAPDLPPVRGDSHRLEQIVVNLVVNACQAAPGGVVVVGTSPEIFDPRRRALARTGDQPNPTANGRRTRERGWTPRPRRTDLAPGTGGVLLYVADDGPGVREDDRERIFDPFFTTKDPGEGTGLGLAIVARTVHEAGGTVWVDRAREGGAVFKVFLPFAVRSAPPVVELSYAPAYC